VARDARYLAARPAYRAACDAARAGRKLPEDTNYFPASARPGGR
jgi:hypothetical protein